MHYLNPEGEGRGEGKEEGWEMNTQKSGIIQNKYLNLKPQALQETQMILLYPRTTPQARNKSHRKQALIQKLTAKASDQATTEQACHNPCSCARGPTGHRMPLKSSQRCWLDNTAQPPTHALQLHRPTTLSPVSTEALRPTQATGP